MSSLTLVQFEMIKGPCHVYHAIFIYAIIIEAGEMGLEKRNTMEYGKGEVSLLSYRFLV